MAGAEGAHSHPGAAKWKAVLDAYQGRKHLGRAPPRGPLDASAPPPSAG